MEEVLNEEGLLVLNNQNSLATFYDDMGQSTQIDVSGISPTLVLSMGKWPVYENIESL